MEKINAIYQIISNNQILMTGLGLSGAGILTFWLKDVPRKIYRVLQRELTTELTITNQHKVFYEIMMYIDATYRNKNFRKIKLSNGRWGDSDTFSSIGYGFHIIRYKKRLIYVYLNREDANQTNMDKETLTLMKFGRSRKLFDQFINDVKDTNAEDNGIKLYSFQDRYWSYNKVLHKRSMDSVFIEREKKDLIISTIKSFLSNEKWYLDNGVPYQLGLLFYGPPGTGKTSLIKALATIINYPVYYLPSSKLGFIEKAVADLPNKCILVIEDIDSNSITHDRSKSRKHNKRNTNKGKPSAISVVEGPDETSDDSAEGSESLYDMISMESLSQVLNSLDGMFSVHGRILIATTNHIEKLDAALIRPGRIDIKVEVGYVNNEILKEFMHNFYPKSTINFATINIREYITVAMLQNMVLQKFTDKEIIAEIEDIGEYGRYTG